MHACIPAERQMDSWGPAVGSTGLKAAAHLIHDVSVRASLTCVPFAFPPLSHVDSINVSSASESTLLRAHTHVCHEIRAAGRNAPHKMERV